MSIGYISVMEKSEVIADRVTSSRERNRIPRKRFFLIGLLLRLIFIQANKKIYRIANKYQNQCLTLMEFGTGRNRLVAKFLQSPGPLLRLLLSTISDLRRCIDHPFDPDEPYFSPLPFH